MIRNLNARLAPWHRDTAWSRVFLARDRRVIIFAHRFRETDVYLNLHSEYFFLKNKLTVYFQI